MEFLLCVYVLVISQSHECKFWNSKSQYPEPGCVFVRLVFIIRNHLPHALLPSADVRPYKSSLSHGLSRKQHHQGPPAPAPHLPLE